MSTDAPNIPDTVAPAATIDHDLPCCHCGYNLRTLPRDGRCPECAEPVPNTLYLVDLTQAPAPYLDAVRRGVTTYLLAGFLAVAAQVFFFFLVYLSRGHAEFILWRYSLLGSAVEFAIWALAPLLFLRATYQLTTPTGVARDRLATVCRILRGATVAWAIVWLLLYLDVPAWWADPDTGYRASRLIAPGLGAVEILLNVACAALLWFWAARFVVRIGANRLVAHARLLTYLVPIATLVPLAYSWIRYCWYVYSGPVAIPLIELIAGILVYAVFLTSAVWQIVLLLRLRSALARLAPATWSADLLTLGREAIQFLRKSLSTINRAIHYHGPSTPPPRSGPTT